MYLSASHEVLSGTLLVTWVLTFWFFPEQIMEHPARPIIGSFNPCFGWDYPPASYIALTACSTNVYLTWRYAFLEQTRTHLMNAGKLTWTQAFACRSAAFLGISSCTWLLLWVLGPTEDHPRDDDGPVIRNWIIHTGIFVLYGLASFLAALGNYLEVRSGPYASTVERKHTIFIITYGVSLTYLVIVYFYDLLSFEWGQEPALPPFMTQTADVVWIACVSSITTFLPAEPPLRIKTEVVIEEEAQRLKAEA